MKKFFADNKYLQIIVSALTVITLSIIIFQAVTNAQDIFRAIGSFLDFLLKTLEPFVFGFFIAYFINEPMKFIEKYLRFAWTKIAKREPKLKSLRFVSILVTYVLTLILFSWLLVVLIPELSSSIASFVKTGQNLLWSFNTGGAFVSDNYTSVNEFLSKVNEIFLTDYTLDGIIKQWLDPILKIFGSMPDIISQILSRTILAARSLLNIVLGAIISIYMLSGKEKLIAGAHKAIMSALPERIGIRVLEVGYESNYALQKFIVGKTIDSLIIGLMFFVVSIFLKLPFPILLSIIIGVTNMIPYFGPFIGAAPVIFIVLVSDPMQSLWTAIAILIIQQLDGNLIGPKILGSSTGLTPLAVIFAITCGGALFGLPGMFFGVPLFSVIYAAGRTIINKRYAEKAEGRSESID